MRLWIGLHLPQLPLETFSPHWRTEDAGCVILEHERVLAASPAALACGVRLGMRRGGVIMLMPDPRLVERSSEAEGEAVNTVAMALLQFTPQVAIGEEATVLIDIGASLELFGGIRSLCRRVKECLRTLGFSGYLSCAPTARGAWLLARSRAGRVLKGATLGRRLDSLPSTLPLPARRFSDWLQGIGCVDIGALRRLPRPGLQRRCGRALLDVLDEAYGETPELFDWIEAPDTFHARIELFDRIDNAAQCLAGAGRLVEQLAGWMSAHQVAAEKITLLLEHERGRVARAPTAIEVVLGEPAWQGGHLLRLLRERLDRTTLDAPVIGLALDAVQLQPMKPLNESLFPDAANSDEDRGRLIELLVARLGADNVLQPLPRADYRPEVANAWVPIEQKVREAERAAQLPTDIDSLPRPAWILENPIALLIVDERPFYTSPLRLVSSAERIEAGWWESGKSRDYFVAEGADSTLYWIFRERISSTGDGEQRWYLQGLFG